MTTTEDHVELVAELVRLLETRILDPLEILLTSDELLSPIRARLRVEAEVWAAQLLGPDQGRATATAARLIGVLFPGDGPFDPPESWWRSALGRVVARTAGHPTAAAVPYATAGAMLGITRQGVHDLVKRGKLDRHPDGGVTTSSIRDRLNRPQESIPWHRTT
ncbi:hypothetical protein B0I32_102111 [Nonomuraea fuscirosea]|uniref:Uncharacterized protein n=1 Tax=Nonomuraea fuscirosea TaxID=1291556 RepID=A0A2T0N8F9_9ACTN|nr:hypothetical protein [Nonomuraea fuscirosea]PRX69055.1 hypothetical protein B0I32_102111 [Nonomuraea fuscirosea]